MPSTTLNLWRTADLKQWRASCPFAGHHPPVIMRDPDPTVVHDAMALHIKVVHGWDVTSSRKPEEVPA